jgi:hypothetical protein
MASLGRLPGPLQNRIVGRPEMAGKPLTKGGFPVPADAWANQVISAYASAGRFVIRCPAREHLSRLFLGSSAVEHSTVNRMVAGSNPARGANSFHLVEKPPGATRVVLPHALTRPQAEKPGSPVERLGPAAARFQALLLHILLRRPANGLSRVGRVRQAAARGFDLRFGRPMAAGPHLRGRCRILRHVKANHRARYTLKNTGLLARKSSRRER